MAELTAEVPTCKWSIASAASAACGALIVVPFFAGLSAIILGFVGLRETSAALMRGRRLAIAGIVLGLANIVGWSVYLRFISEISSPGRTVAHHFIDDLGGSDPGVAQRECAGTVRADRLAEASDQIKQWGGVKNVAVLHITSNTDNGVTTGSVRGTVGTPSGDHVFELQTASDGDSDWKVSGFSFR